ncbi:MAG: DUF3143 domain-containing protein [Stenomitos rutilans HA7619-LM2]|jgi:hypothetical protein|nr:DUF3143 domain-containing protein [Stenomitos rutilans HA7619-LM2]
MPLPAADTPLYNHPLPEIEQWLRVKGCEQDRSERHCWHIQHSSWKAELCLDIDQLTVRYKEPNDNDYTVQRSFKYSLSRQDIEDAVFAGP